MGNREIALQFTNADVVKDRRTDSAKPIQYLLPFRRFAIKIVVFKTGEKVSNTKIKSVYVVSVRCQTVGKTTNTL